MSNEKMDRFKAWKNYTLPPLNFDGQFQSDWLHREWVAFQAGYQAAIAQQASAENAIPRHIAIDRERSAKSKEKYWAIVNKQKGQMK